MPMKVYEASLTGAQANTVLLQIDSQDNAKGETFSAVAIQTLTIGTSAVLNFEQSNDGVNWRTLPAWDTTTITATIVTTVAAVGMVASQWYSRFFRIRITGQTAGTTSVAVVASDAEFAAQNTQVGGSVTVAGTVGVAASAAASGVTVTRVKSAATTNATLLKAVAGNLYGVHVSNTTSSAKFLKFYNKATAPTVGTDVPLFTIPIAPNGRVDIDFTFPVRFTLGIGIAITGAVADTDTTVTAVDDVTGLLVWL